MTRFLFPQSAILDILERSLWWVLSHEKFCYHPLLLLKICPLLWATLLSMHCSCMLMEERSIHRLILQYFATVSNYKWCHVCNWWFHFREDGTHYKTGQERIPVEITISNRQKQWCAGVLGSTLSCPSTILAYSCYSSQFVAFCHISRLSLPFSLSKCRILWNLLFLLFLPYLLPNLFT